MSSDIAPEAIAGDALEAMLNAVDEDVEHFPRQKYTAADALRDDDDPTVRQRLLELSSVLPGGPPAQQRRQMQTLDEFVKCHRGGETALGGGLLDGRERTGDIVRG